MAPCGFPHNSPTSRHQGEAIGLRIHLSSPPLLAGISAGAARPTPKKSAVGRWVSVPPHQKDRQKSSRRRSVSLAPRRMRQSSTDLLLVEASFSEKYEFVNWDVGMMIIPHVWKNIRCAKPPTNIDGRGTEMESLLNLGLFQCEKRANSR